MSYILKHKQDIYIYILAQNIKSNCSIISLNSFPIIFADGKCIPSNLFIYKRFNLWFLVDVFLFFHATVTAYWKYLLSFLLIGFIVAFLFLLFLSNQENLYMINQNSDIFYDIYDTINEHNNYELSTSHWFFQSNLIIFNKWLKKFFNHFICFIINHDF